MTENNGNANANKSIVAAMKESAKTVHELLKAYFSKDEKGYYSFFCNQCGHSESFATRAERDHAREVHYVRTTYATTDKGFKRFKSCRFMIVGSDGVSRRPVLHVMQMARDAEGGFDAFV